MPGYLETGRPGGRFFAPLGTKALDEDSKGPFLGLTARIWHPNLNSFWVRFPTPSFVFNNILASIVLFVAFSRVFPAPGAPLGAKDRWGRGRSRTPRSSTPRLFDLILCFHRHSRIARRFFECGSAEVGAFYPPPQSFLAAFVRRTSPAIAASRGGVEHRGRSSDILSLCFVFIDILALFPKKHLSTISFQLAAAPFRDGADPDVWGLRCPEGTGQGKRQNLTEPRLRRIANVQRQI